MSTVVEIPRSDDKSELPSWRPFGEGPPIVACPHGHDARIGDHSVEDDGTVSPSLVCPGDGCTWHVFGILVGWVA